MFNSGRMGWEPVIEPWTFRVGLTAMHPTEAPARSPDASLGPSCLSASFASDFVLEATMTLAQFDTAAAAMRVMRQVRGPQDLGCQRLAAYTSSSLQPWSIRACDSHRNRLQRSKQTV